MISTELLKQIKHIQLKAGHLASEVMSGEYVSAFKGKGMEFDEVRDYLIGDDVRAIDWNVTARMNSPFIKVFREEREMTLMLMVDVSPSQRFTSTGRSKQEVSAELAAVLAFLAIRNNDKVGLILLSDHVESYIAPKKGRAHIWNIIRSVVSHKPSGSKTDIAGVMEYLVKVTKRKSLCFLISDFWSESYENTLKSVSRRHDLVCVSVEDRREAELKDMGFVRMLDSETGTYSVVDTSSHSFKKYLASETLRRKDSMEKMFRKSGADFFAINTSESIVNGLVGFLRRRERRRG